MFQSRREFRSPLSARPQVLSVRAAFTMLELLIAMTILSFSVAIFTGLTLATTTAWDHSSDLEETRRQAQSVLNRIKWMVPQAGTYRLAGQSTVVGLAVVSTSWAFYQAPATLVVWSGGAAGGMHQQGELSRLPLASELVVYCPDTRNPAEFVEATFPGNTTSMDFRSTTFPTAIQALLASTSCQKVRLCDRLHGTAAQGMGSGAANIANARFEISLTPSETAIAGVTTASAAWNSLPWSQGLVGDDRGLRTANVRVELLLDPDPASVTASNGFSTAIPFPGSVNRTYVYRR